MTHGVVRRRMSVEGRRQQLISVALDLFSRYSPEDVSIDDIASAAGISRPLVYHYFPGKRHLYEAALRRAADELSARLEEPLEGSFSGRLLRVMGRYFDFVEEHGPGFAALLRGGTAVGSRHANAMIDGVRDTAFRQMARHLGVRSPGPQLALVIRSWVALAEATALTWWDDREIPRDVLERKLVGNFLALASVTATQDPETATLLRAILATEPPDGPLGDLPAVLASLGPRTWCPTSDDAAEESG